MTRWAVHPMYPPCRCSKCIRDFTTRRLAWRYDRETALRCEAGEDPRYEADKQAWRELGR